MFGRLQDRNIMTERHDGAKLYGKQNRGTALERKRQGTRHSTQHHGSMTHSDTHQEVCSTNLVANQVATVKLNCQTMPYSEYLWPEIFQILE